MKAKVVHLTSVHGAYDPRIFCRECKSLAGAQYEVVLVACHDADEFIDGVRIKAVPRINHRLGRITCTVWRVYREAVRQGAAVYHFHDPELIPVGLALRAHGKKVVYDIHENLPKDILTKYYLPQWLRRPVAWLAERAENRACRCFSALAVTTPAIADRVRTFNPNTVVICNFPVAEDFVSPAEIIWSERDFAVAYVGLIDSRRGIWEMVEAMSLLPDKLQATLRLAGDFDPPSIQEQATRLPGWKRVEALGVLNQAGVLSVLGRVRAGLVLVQETSARYKPGYPIKMFEYMSMGLPVIASDRPLWREIIQGNRCGLLVDPRKPEEIASAIEHLLCHPEEAEAMGRRGRLAVENEYNWGKECPKLLQLYASLVEPEEQRTSAVINAQSEPVAADICPRVSP
jgi:glycosyltransferase involved in cell wall biosynthesis